MEALVAEALDGSKKVIAARDSASAALVKMLRQLGGYAGFIANDDERTIVLSGFHYVSTSRNRAPTLNKAIRTLAPGDISGTMKLKAVDVDGASSYEVRFAARQIDRSSLPSEYTVKKFSDTRKYLIITGLTPGIYYVFQVRALIGENHTDWSDAAMQMCI